MPDDDARRHPVPVARPPRQAGPFRDYLASINVTGAPRVRQGPRAVGHGARSRRMGPTTDPMFATGIEFVQPVGATGSLRRSR